MMNILVHIPSIDENFDPNDTTNPITSEEIFSTIKMRYKDSGADYDVYDRYSCTLGINEPEYIIYTGRNWNAAITRQAAKRIGDLIKLSEKEWPTSNEAMELCDPARELADNWWPFAKHAVYVNNEMNYSYFRCTLTPEMEQDITKHPEKWAVLTIYPT